MTQLDRESSVKSVLSVVASIGVPVTVVGGLMYYFGWARTSEQARYMGLDVSVYGYGMQDYVMRSIGTLFRPLLGLAILGLAWLGLHHVVRGWLAKPRLSPILQAAGRVAAVAGTVLAALWLLVSFTPVQVEGRLVAPPVMAVGAAVAGYGLWLARAATPPAARRPIPAGHRALGGVLLAGIIALAMFLALGDYAAVKGRQIANDLAHEVAWLPRATAFSATPLGVDAPGVLEEMVVRDPPLYRLTGLRLLARSGGRMFLLHDGWRPETGRVIVVPDGGAVSWVFSR